MTIHAPERPVTQTMANFFLLQETGFKILPEDGSAIMTEGTSPVETIHAKAVSQILHTELASTVISI